MTTRKIRLMTCSLFIVGSLAMGAQSNALADDMTFTMSITTPSSVTNFAGQFQSTDFGNPGAKCKPNSDGNSCQVNHKYSMPPKNMKFGICIDSGVAFDYTDACSAIMINNKTSSGQPCDGNTIVMTTCTDSQTQYKAACKYTTNASNAGISYQLSKVKDQNQLDCSISGMAIRPSTK